MVGVQWHLRDARCEPPCPPWQVNDMDHRTRLVDVIRSVRNRWRLRLAMRGAVVVVAGTVLALLLSASGLESFRFSAAAIFAFRIISITIFVGLLAYGLVCPLRRRY